MEKKFLGMLPPNSIVPLETFFPLSSLYVYDEKKGTFKVISFYAKRARGLLARYVIQNQIKHPQGLSEFNLEGYQYDPERSSLEAPVFIRFEKDRSKK